MSSEWMKVMLEEISRKKAEAEQARLDAEHAHLEGEQARVDAEQGGEPRRDDAHASPRAPRTRRRSARRPRQAR